MTDDRRVMRQTTEAFSNRHWPNLQETPYQYMTRVTFLAGFAAFAAMAYSNGIDNVIWIVVNGLVGGFGWSGIITPLYIFFVTHRVTQQELTVVSEEYEPTPEPRAIQGNRGTLRMRPETAVSVTHGNDTFVFTPTLLKAMERLYKDRADTDMQQVARDQLGVPTAEYPRMIHVLQGVGYLNENSRYTVRGVSWLLVDSYSPTPS